MPASLPRSVSVVGNAPDAVHHPAAIDGADWVVRFNNAAGFGAGSGSRVTHLALVNHGGQMREWLEDPGFTRRPVVASAAHVLFPFARKVEPAECQSADGRDWTDAALAALAPLGPDVTILPDRLQAAAQRLLSTPARPDPVPSTGFLVMLHLLETLDATVRIGVFGFGFDGWNGHAWEAERRWFEDRAMEGRIVLHPLAARRRA